MRNTKKMLYIISFCLIVMFCISCRKENRNLLSLFDVERTLQHAKIGFKNDDYLSMTGGLCMNDNYLIVTDKSGETWITVFDLKYEQIVNKFITYGNGPYEMFSPPQAVTIHQQNQISYLDVQTKKLYLADFSELDNVKITQQLDLVNSETFFMAVMPMSNDFYIGTGFFEKGRYAVLDKTGNIVSYNFDFPEDDINQSTTAHKAMAYQGKMVRDKKGTKLFYYCVYSEILEIMSLDEKGTLVKIKDIHYDKAQYVPEGQSGSFVSSAIKRESKISFLDAEATEKYIYLLYSGRVIGENLMLASKGNTILVFDWSGNPVRSYKLDIDVSYITVSEDDKILYAIAEMDDTAFVKFDL